MATDRAGYVAGLRALADLLEEHDGLPLPYEGSQSLLSFFTDSREQCAAVVRLMEGTARKEYTDSPGYGFSATGTIAGLRVIAYAMRDDVCTRVVKGTREVVKEVPDPDALAAVPTVTVTETVEDVEWICEPLLAPREQVTA